jgi:hypothetical protein
MNTIWKYLAIIFLFFGTAGLLASQAVFKKDFNYALYAGPHLTITSEIDRLHAVTSSTSAEDWRSLISTEGSDLFQSVYASYNLTRSGDCKLEIHDYVVEAHPDSIIGRVDVSYSTTSRFYIVQGKEETLIDSLSKMEHDPESEPSREIEIDLNDLENEYNLSYPYEIKSITIIDYKASNQLSQNASKYTLEDFRLLINDGYVYVERFSDVPYVELTGLSTHVYEARDMGLIMLAFGLLATLQHHTKSKVN